MNEITTFPYDLVLVYCSEFSKIGFVFGLSCGVTFVELVRLVGKIIADLIKKYKKVD